MCKHTHINRQCKFVNCRRCKLERSLFIRRNIFRGNFAISFLISFRHTAEYIPVRKYSRANLRVTTMFVSENSLILPALCATCRNGWLLFLSLRILSLSLSLPQSTHWSIMFSCLLVVYSSPFAQRYANYDNFHIFFVHPQKIKRNSPGMRKSECE